MGRQAKPNRHPSGWWRFTFDGTVRWHRTEEEAAAHLRQLQAQRAAEAHEPLSVPGLVRSYVAHLSGDKLTEGLLKSFAAFAVDVPLGAVDADLLARYVAELAAKGYTAWSIRKKLYLAHAAIGWACEKGWLAVVPPLPKMPRPQRNPRGLRAEDLNAILDRMVGERRRALDVLRFIAVTGCRPAEACGLVWSDVDLAAGVCVIRQHKTAHATGLPRTIYLTPQAVSVLESIPRKRSGPVFLSRLCEPFTPAGLRSTFTRAAKEALGHHAGPYVLRHTFAQFASRSVPVDVLAKLMGHTSISTTQLYYAVEDQTARRAARGLELAELRPAPVETRAKTRGAAGGLKQRRAKTGTPRTTPKARASDRVPKRAGQAGAA